MSQQNDERLSTAELAAAAERREASTSESGSTTTVIAPESKPVERGKEDVSAAERAPQDVSAAERAKQDVSAAERQEPLFDPNQAQTLRGRWSDIQAGFVDEPRRAVEQADSLVAEVMQHLAQAFSEARSTLEQQWDRGDDVNTEDLRQALRRYRSFFDRLLSM
jgi:hypothetical protein